MNKAKTVNKDNSMERQHVVFIDKRSLFEHLGFFIIQGMVIEGWSLLSGWSILGGGL